MLNLLGLPLCEAKALLERQGLKYVVVPYYAKRVVGEEQRVIRVTEDSDGVCLVVSGFSSVPQEKGE